MTSTAPHPLPRVRTQLICSDFDESLADADSDRWVHEVLAPDLRRRFDQPGGPQFTDLCAALLRELHARGVTPKQIEDALRRMYFHPAMARGVKATAESQTTKTTWFLLSNANTVYIDTILKDQNIRQYFIEIVTNPAYFESSGLLHLRRRVDPAGPQHTCTVGCSANMCKGDELEAFLARHGGREAFERVVYIGDGGNDYCPVMRMREGDVALVRTKRGLQRRIEQEGTPKAGIRYWSEAWEVEGILAELRGEEL